MEKVQISKKEFLEDISLTLEEKRLLENIKERIKNDDYSEFISIEDVKI